MNTKVSLGFAHFGQTILVILLLSILIFVSTGTHVKGQIGGEESFRSQDETSTEGVIEGTGVVEGGPGFIMVSPMDFRPAYPSQYNVWDYGGGGGGLINPSEGATAFRAGLTLPHDATLTKLVLYYKDSNATQNLSITLGKGDFESNTSNMASLQTSGEATDFRILSTTVIADRVVDNQNYSYFLYLWFPGGAVDSIMLTNVRIDYAYTSNLPAVMKN